MIREEELRCVWLRLLGQRRPTASSLVPLILRDNWRQHWDKLISTPDPEPNNLI
jgi:hypothetical protein